MKSSKGKLMRALVLRILLYNDPVENVLSQAIC